MNTLYTSHTLKSSFLPPSLLPPPSFLPSYHRYLLRANYVSGLVLGPWNTVVGKTGMPPDTGCLLTLQLWCVDLVMPALAP